MQSAYDDDVERVNFLSVLSSTDFYPALNSAEVPL